MKEFIVKLKDWWSNLAARERQAVTIGSLLTLVFCLYQFVWSPLSASATTLRQRLVAQEKLLVWMQAANAELQKHTNESTAQKTVFSSPVVALGVLQREITRAGLDQYVTQLKQASNETIEMHFQKLQFDKLMELLEVLNTTQKISIVQMSVAADTSPGIVAADLVLKV